MRATLLKDMKYVTYILVGIVVGVTFVTIPLGKVPVSNHHEECLDMQTNNAVLVCDGEEFMLQRRGIPLWNYTDEHGSHLNKLDHSTYTYINFLAGYITGSAVAYLLHKKLANRPRKSINSK
jgi:hypothetical protein